MEKKALTPEQLAQKAEARQKILQICKSEPAKWREGIGTLPLLALLTMLLSGEDPEDMDSAIRVNIMLDDIQETLERGIETLKKMREEVQSQIKNRPKDG